MTVRTKSELKSIFVTDAIPTEQNFTDLVDTFVTKVNNVAPNTDGNVTLNIPSATPVVNNLTSTATTSALSASQGKVLNDDLTAHKAITASTSVSGHVKVDNTTIGIANGVISVNQSLLDGLQNGVNTANTNLTTHAALNASSTAKGHVQVDGATIQATAAGVISVRGATTSLTGVVQLTNALSTSATTAVTPNAVNTAINTINASIAAINTRLTDIETRLTALETPTP